MESRQRLHLLRPVDWRVLRAARLQALLDSPRAFTSSYARELRWSKQEWRRMLNAATWIVAHEADTAVGLARSVGDPERPGTRHVESMWVAPTHRRRGVCRDVLHALAKTARSMGATDLLLWVLEDNHDAQRAYDALGFEPTGERQFLSDFGRFERRLRLGIGLLDVPAGRDAEVNHSSAKLGQSPGLQLKEVHSIASAANIVHPV